MQWEYAEWLLKRRPRVCPFCATALRGSLIPDRIAGAPPRTRTARTSANWGVLEGPQIRWTCPACGYGDLEPIDRPKGGSG